MAVGLGHIPPPDPPRERALRAAAARRRVEERLAMLLLVLLVLQVVLALLAGVWAGAAGGGTDRPAAGWAALGMVLLLLGANAVAYVLLLMVGGVSLLAMLPRALNARPPGREAAPPSAAGARLSRIAVAGLWLGHALLLLAGALLLLALLNSLLGAPGWDAWWRCVLAALGLAAISGRIVLALGRAGPL
jgi:hypothetical protein